MDFELKVFRRSLYLIISLCIFISGCSFPVIQEEQEKRLMQVEMPQADEIIKSLKDKSPDKQHPRLMATQDDFKRIKKEIKTDSNMKKWYQNLRTETGKILKEPVVRYEFSDDVRLLPVSQTVLKRTINLSMMYRLTGDNTYADRAWKELRTVADDNKFPDWHPSHFLDTAEMTNAVAIGYDWLYDYLSVRQRELLRESLIEKGLKPALQVYNGTAKSSEITTSWRDTTSNWNTICNGGIGMGALAIADESPEAEALSGEILQYAVESIKNSLTAYAPDGGMPEGPSYWNYATSYMAYFLSALESALGTDFGLSKMEGLSETGYYPIYIGGTEGSFNIGDSKKLTISIAPQLFWFANKYNNLDFFHFALRGNNPMNLIWYRKKEEKDVVTTQLPLDKRFINSETGIVTMRSNWKNNAFFIGMHAGYDKSYHGDLDTGSFVLDALGVRWAEDLGADNYNLPGYFEMDSRRWSYYRKRAEGNNTLVINPKNKPDQNINARATITNFGSTSQQGFSIIDMTSAYDEEALSVKRGIALTEKRTTIVLQDELKLKKPSEVYWFMHTQAQIKLTNDKKTAILTYSGKRIYAHIVSPTAGSFTVMEAKPLSTSPKPVEQASNEGIKKLAVHLKGIKNTKISIVFKVDNEDATKWPQPLPLSKWSASQVVNSN